MKGAWSNKEFCHQLIRFATDIPLAVVDYASASASKSLQCYTGLDRGIVLGTTFGKGSVQVFFHWIRHIT